MKKIVALLLTAVMTVGVLCSCSVAGDLLSSFTKKEDVKITSSDGKYSVMAPGTWEDLAGQLNSSATLEAGNLKDEQYMAVLPDNKEDLNLSFDEYVDIVYENILSAVQGAEQKERESVSINGKNGYCMEVTGTVDNINVTYWIYTIDAKEDYLQVLTWTLKSKADTNKEILQKTVETLTEEAK